MSVMRRGWESSAAAGPGSDSRLCPWHPGSDVPKVQILYTDSSRAGIRTHSDAEDWLYSFVFIYLLSFSHFLNGTNDSHAPGHA